MSDVDEITALINEYAFRLDAGDLDGVAALFEHAELGSTRHDHRYRGAAEARTIYDNVIVYDDDALTFLRVHGRTVYDRRAACKLPLFRP